MKKRILSMLLSLLMIFSIVPTLTFTVFAQSAIKTQAETLNWLKAQEGASYNFSDFRDDSGNLWGGTQCVEFVRAYVNWLINGNPWTDAWNGPTYDGDTIWNNPIWGRLGWKVYPNTPDFLPLPGDIFSSAACHTGVVISSDLATAVIADANARNNNGYDGDPVWVHKITWKSAGNGAYGANYYIRPIFKNDSPNYSLDVNVHEDGNIKNDGIPNCTYNVSINGSVVKQNVQDFCTAYSAGSTYKVDNINVTGCYRNKGQSSYSGTLNSNVSLYLEIETYHPPKTVEGKSATCTESGLTSGTVCSKCGTVLTAQQTIPAKGHNYVSETIPGTCTEPTKVKYTCTVCGETKYEYTDGIFGNWTETKPAVSGNETIESKTQYQYREKIYKESTSASETGWTRRTDKEPTVSYSSWGNWSAWKTGSLSGSETREVESKALYRYCAFECPNCGQRDPLKGYCSKCGKVNLSSEHWTEIWSPIAYKDSGSSVYLVSYKRATTKIDGTTWIFSAGNLNSTAVGTKDSDSDAVVITNGYRYRDRTKTTTYYYEKWSDWSSWSDNSIAASNTVEVQTRTLYRTVTPASGGSHSWDSGKVTTAATCAKTGVKTYTCTVCGATKTETVAKKTTHTWNSGKVTTAATCAKTGVKTYTCTVCGETKTETVAKTTSHKWDSGKITKAATAAADGVKTYTCTVCGKTKTEAVKYVAPVESKYITASVSGNTAKLYFKNAKGLEYTKLNIKYKTSEIKKVTLSAGADAKKSASSSNAYTELTNMAAGNITYGGYFTESLESSSYNFSNLTFELASGVAEAKVTVTGTVVINGKKEDVNTVITVSGAKFIYGDIDDDGDVTVGDARLALRGAIALYDNKDCHGNKLDLITKTTREYKAADVDCDTDITVGDARLILRYAIGLEKKLGK